MMLVKCSECGKKYERWNMGEYGYPYLCKKCKSKTKILLGLVFLFTILILTQVVYAEIYKQNDVVDIKIQCINNGTFCSSAGVCNITILYPKNATMFVNNALMTNQTSFYNYTLTSSSVLGYYPCSVTCCDGVYCGTNQDCSFTINQTGTEFTIGQSILYILGFILMIIMFLFFIYGSFRIKWKHGYNDEGKIISVNHLKYFKIVCIVFAYIMLLFIFAFAKSITENLLDYNAINVVFNWAYWIMLSTLYPILVLSFIIMLIVMIDNYVLGKKAKRRYYR